MRLALPGHNRASMHCSYCKVAAIHSPRGCASYHHLWNLTADKSCCPSSFNLAIGITLSVLMCSGWRAALSGAPDLPTQ